MSTILILAIVVMGWWLTALYHENTELKKGREPCGRCGATGTTRPYQGPPAWPHFFTRPLALCAECRDAQDSFIGHKFMLETEGRLHFGRYRLVGEAEAEWGDEATDMLALMMVARESMDRARRVLSEESFEQARYWLEEYVNDYTPMEEEEEDDE